MSVRECLRAPAKPAGPGAPLRRCRCPRAALDASRQPCQCHRILSTQSAVAKARTRSNIERARRPLPPPLTPLPQPPAFPPCLLSHPPTPPSRQVFPDRAGVMSRCEALRFPVPCPRAPARPAQTRAQGRGKKKINKRLFAGVPALARGAPSIAGRRGSGWAGRTRACSGLQGGAGGADG